MPKPRSKKIPQTSSRACISDKREIFQAQATHTFRGITGLDHVTQLESFIDNSFPHISGYNGESIHIRTFRRWLRKYDTGYFDNILASRYQRRHGRMNWNSVESGIRQQLIERLKTMSVGDLKDLSGRGILEIFANVQKDLNVRPAFTRSVKWAYKCRWEALRDVPIEVMTEHVEHRYKNGLLIAAQQPTDTHGGREVDVAEAEIVHGAAAHGDDSDKMAADLRKVHHSTDTRCLRRSSRLKKKMS
mmetsp:Transcript_9602/g.14299  ORF Transcript_9602/g.14299 Transcript_9602/m.14299 type:complete len:246 (-) Transcript_9602:737-1474(-)